LAALLDTGGLWVLYRTRLFAATDDRPWLHAAVHAHVFATGLIFTAAVCQLDPVRRRAPDSPLSMYTLLPSRCSTAAISSRSRWQRYSPPVGTPRPAAVWPAPAAAPAMPHRRPPHVPDVFSFPVSWGNAEPSAYFHHSSPIPMQRWAQCENR
jgi:hypothetical protein